MARSFNSATPDLLRVASAVKTSYPWTMACWFRQNNTTQSRCQFWMGKSSATNQLWAMETTSAAKLTFSMRASSPIRSALTSNTITLSTWQHGAIIAASAASRTAVLNGDWANRGTNTVSGTPSGINRTTIGRWDGSSAFDPFDGRIAEACLWDVALVQDEIEALNRGVAPYRVRPQNVAAYWPLVGTDSPEPDWSGGGFGLTLFGSPALADHAPVALPRLLGWIPTAEEVAAAPPSANVPAYMASYRRRRTA